MLPLDLLDVLLEFRESRLAVPPEFVVGSSNLATTCRPSYGVSPRELMVVPFLREGLSNKEIARELGITEATVKVHVKALLRKARVKKPHPACHVGGRCWSAGLHRAQINRKRCLSS